MSESETVTGDETATDNLSPQEKGERIAAMVDAEEARVLAAEAAETEDETTVFPCPVCGGDIALPNAPKQDPNKVRCNACDGWGMTATGSMAPDMQVAPCTVCDGRGWQPIHAVYTPPVPVPEQPPENLTQNAEPVGEFPPVAPVDISQVKLG